MANDEIRRQTVKDFYSENAHPAAVNRAREHFDNMAWRFLSNEFISTLHREYNLFLGWVHEAPYFAHVSALDDTKIAYFPTIKHLQECRPVSVRAGKFFRRCLGEEINDAVVAQITNKYIACSSYIEVLFAETADEIEEVYVHGPRSCMGGKEDDEWCMPSINPARVYATPDIMLAYIKNSRGSISARVLINKNNKEYSVAYGNSETLISELRKLGYRSGTLNGCRINHIEENGAIVMPYIDNCEAIDDDGTGYFYICEDQCDAINSIGVPDKTNGLLHEVERCSTSGCSNWVNVDDSNRNYVIHLGTICNDCIESSSDEYVPVWGKNTPHGLAPRRDAVYLAYIDSYVYYRDYENDLSTFRYEGHSYRMEDTFKLGLYPKVLEDGNVDNTTIVVSPQAVKSPNGDWYTYYLDGEAKGPDPEEIAAQYLWQRKPAVLKRLMEMVDSEYFVSNNTYTMSTYKDRPVKLAAKLLRRTLELDARFECISSQSLDDLFELMVTDDILAKVNTLIQEYEKVADNNRPLSTRSIYVEGLKCPTIT